MSGSDRLHRSLLLGIGVLILVAGAASLLAGTGVFGHRIEDQHLYASATAHYIARNGSWLWPAAAALSIVLAVLALIWLRAQASSPRTRLVRVPSEHRQGRTILDAGALTGAVTHEIESFRGVRSARASLIGDSRHPNLRLDVTLDTKADFGRLRHRIDDEAIAHLRSAMAPVGIPTSIDYDISTQPTRRV